MSVSYTLRLPDNLKSLIDLAAKNGGLSTARLVIDACWAYLDRGAVAQSGEQGTHNSRGAGSIPASTTKPTIDDLRAICAAESENKQCAYREYDSELGEWFGCSLPEHGPKIKHKRGPKL